MGLIWIEDGGEGTEMTTTEERLATLEQGFENEQEWRREMNAKIDRLDTKFNWTIGLLILILIAIIGSNWIG